MSISAGQVAQEKQIRKKYVPMVAFVIPESNFLEDRPQMCTNDRSGRRPDNEFAPVGQPFP